MTSRRASTLTAGAITVALVLVACTGEEPGPEPTEAAPEHRVPLALVTHHSAELDDVSAEQVRAVASGDVDDWSQLDAPAGSLSVVEDVDAVAEDPDAIAVVDADAVDPRVRVPLVDGEDPLLAEEDFLLARASRTPAATPVTLTIGGDIMLGRRVGELLERVDDPAAVWRPLAERLASADITVGNLESTLSVSGEPTQGGDSFGADPSVLAGLELAGFDVVSLANNHLGDYGDDAIGETVDELAEAGLETVGGGRDLDEAAEPLVVERDGVRIGFVATDSIGETPAATSDSPGTNRINAPPRTGPLDADALDRVAADVAAADADVVVAIPHWGTQYTNVPERSQRQIASALVEAGADLVVGGHPHWVQGWETIGESTIVHSLGNFVFDMDFMRENTEGVFVEVIVRGDRVVSVAPVPYVIDGEYTPREVDGDRAEEILDRQRETSDAPFDDVRPR